MNDNQKYSLYFKNARAAGISEDSASETLREARDILSRLFDANRPKRHGLVSGLIQVGKTGLMNALSLLAVHEFAIARLIVLTTNMNSLRDQTQKRICVELGDGDSHITHLTSPDEDVHQYYRNHASLKDQVFPAHTVLVCTIKKSPASLDLLLGENSPLLHHANPGPTFLINDEADNCTVNYGDPYGAPSPMYHRLVRLVEMMNGNIRMLSFSATVQALLLQRADDPLSGDFIHQMNHSRPGSEHSTYVTYPQMRHKVVTSDEYPIFPTIMKDVQIQAEITKYYQGHENQKFLQRFVFSFLSSCVEYKQHLCKSVVQPASSSFSSPEDNIVKLISRMSDVSVDLLTSKVFSIIRSRASQSLSNSTISVGLNFEDLAINDSSQQYEIVRFMADPLGFRPLANVWLEALSKAAGGNIVLRLNEDDYTCRIYRSGVSNPTMRVFFIALHSARSNTYVEVPPFPSHRTEIPKETTLKQSALYVDGRLNKIHDLVEPAMKNAIQYYLSQMINWMAHLKHTNSHVRAYFYEAVTQLDVHLWTSKTGPPSHDLLKQNVIYIGGAIFSRGLSLPNLHTMALLHVPRKVKVDTLIQSLRIQGHHLLRGLIVFFAPQLVHDTLRKVCLAQYQQNRLLTKFSSGDVRTSFVPAVSYQKMQPTSLGKRKHSQISRARDVYHEFVEDKVPVVSTFFDQIKGDLVEKQVLSSLNAFFSNSVDVTSFLRSLDLSYLECWLAVSQSDNQSTIPVYFLKGESESAVSDLGVQVVTSLTSMHLTKDVISAVCHDTLPVMVIRFVCLLDNESKPIPCVALVSPRNFDKELVMHFVKKN